MHATPPEPEGFHDRWQAGQHTEADELYARMFLGIRPLSAEDREFARKLKELVGDRPVVINCRIGRDGLILSDNAWFQNCQLGVEGADA